MSGLDLIRDQEQTNLPELAKWVGEIAELAKPDAVLASNTSGLSITAIASLCQRPERALFPRRLFEVAARISGHRRGYGTGVEDIEPQNSQAAKPDLIC